ncbi:MAG TPA: hypothetical protein VGD40_02255 [Chryseosolibacter sp.]
MNNLSTDKALLYRVSLAVFINALARIATAYIGLVIIGPQAIGRPELLVQLTKDNPLPDFHSGFIKISYLFLRHNSYPVFADGFRNSGILKASIRPAFGF